jgi:photosystem II stability/assembly factor-like uncharacterized protein
MALDAGAEWYQVVSHNQVIGRNNVEKPHNVAWLKARGGIFECVILLLVVAMSALSLYCAIPVLAGESGTDQEGGTIGPLAISPADPLTIYAGSYDGVWKSVNGGTTWTTANSGFTKRIIALAVSPVNSEIVYAGTYDSSIFKTTDGGTSWTKINSGLTVTNIQCFVINPVNRDNIYAGTNAGGGPGRRYLNGGVYKSTDGGKSWTQTNSGLPTVHVRSLAIDPISPQTVYAGTFDKGIFKSTNGGASWTPVNYLPAYQFVSANEITSIAIDPVSPQIIYAGTVTGGVFRTSDGGKSWTKMDQDQLGPGK